MRTHRGVITPEVARRGGLTRHKLVNAHVSGELVRVRHRVYTTRGAIVNWDDELFADLEACWRNAYASHSAALALHGLRHQELPLRRELVVHGSARPTVAQNVVVHRTRRLERFDLTKINGIPCTTVERALIDVAGRLSERARLELMDDAVMKGLADRDLLHGRCLDLVSGRSGVRTLLEATRPGAELAFKSSLEKAGLELLHRAGVRDMRINVIPERAPAAGVTDVVSETDRLIVDWDGLRFHSSRRARERDNEKSNQCALAGYTLLRFTWNHVHHQPVYVIDLARRTVDA
ncbi:DUF559 domain-containing protein [Euzebya tangerina]|uniref:DUF559 domain-containing protein n=1 Tax=Euzebya tangerina TaxID=591198 RepID=UPI0013C36BF5|nr:DUF559 domain-containing protein [Euzebya tangerina]